MVWLLFVYARRLATGAIITAENGRMRQGYTTERATFSNIRAAPNTRPYSIQTRTIATLRVALDLLARRATRDLILSTLNQPLNLHQLTDCFKLSTVERGIVW